MKEFCAYWEEKDFRYKEEQKMFDRSENIKEAGVAEIERRSDHPGPSGQIIQDLVELYYLLLQSTHTKTRWFNRNSFLMEAGESKIKAATDLVSGKKSGL